MKSGSLFLDRSLFDGYFIGKGGGLTGTLFHGYGFIESGREVNLKKLGLIYQRNKFDKLDSYNRRL